MLQSLSVRWKKGKRLSFLALFALAAIAGALLSVGLHREWTSPSNALSGGTTTVFNRTSSAYEQPSAGLTLAEIDRHRDGDIAFEAVFVTAPARVNPGLGPLFNNASCAGCHIRNGRGLPEKGQLLARVSLPQTGQTASHPPIAQTNDYHLETAVASDNAPPVPGLGSQIQDQSIYGHPPEASVEVEWQEQPGQYGDGTPYVLRSPIVQVAARSEQETPADMLVSLRLPPPVFGLGLLEAVPDQEILALADPDDRDRNGISGRPNQVWDASSQSTALGRFGLKANQPDLLQQTAAAYINDMGVTNPLFRSVDQSSDIDQKTLDDATYYVQTLAVPARTMTDDPIVRRGETLFSESNCAACHVTQLRTDQHPVAVLANQTIYPYTDLLLHDMGPGLADDRPDFQASGTEWRTSPLWGMGLTQTVLPYSSYLHDGRARTLEEAILWHGGEAETAKEAFRTSPPDDRTALIRFLRSL